MNRLPRLTLLALTISLMSSAPAVSSARNASQNASQNPEQKPSAQAGQKPPPQSKRKKQPPPTRGFEQFAGRDAADKLILGAARRKSVRRPGPKVRKGTIPSRMLGRQEIYVSEAKQQHAAGNFEAAAAAYRKALELRGKPASDKGELQYALGKVYSDMKRYEEAAAEFRDASTRGASGEVRLNATFELGNVYMNLVEYEKAIDAYNKTLQILNKRWTTPTPRFSPQTLSYVHYNIGLARIGLGQNDQAVADFEKAIEWNPVFPEAHFNLGGTLWKLGRHDAARAAHIRLKALNAELADKLAALFK